MTSAALGARETALLVFSLSATINPKLDVFLPKKTRVLELNSHLLLALIVDSSACGDIAKRTIVEERKKPFILG